MALGQTVTLVNRTRGILLCTFDGEQITIEPGENPGFPAVAVPYAKEQNPIMGTQDPLRPSVRKYLVGVKPAKGVDSRDDISPIEQSQSVELLDRSMIRGIGRHATVQEGDPVTPMEARVAFEGDIDNAVVGQGR